MQKIIMGLFAPALIAIAVRFVLFLIAICSMIIAETLKFIEVLKDVPHWVKTFCDFIVEFDTFSWNESWGFWIIVILFTFYAEMFIFED